MGARHLYLVRHGQYHHQEGHARHGSLTALGRRQARRLSRRLEDVPLVVVHHSDMPRAVETAALLAHGREGLPLRSTRLLRESLPTIAAHWTFDPMPSAASLRATRQRLDEAFRRLFRAPARGTRHELVVAHGNVIRYLVRLALGDPVARWWRLDIQHCSLTHVCVEPPPRGISLLGFNDVGHLPAAMRTHH